MKQFPETYTTAQAMNALGISSRTTFHRLRAKYPKALIAVVVGSGRSNQTQYDKSAIDELAKFRLLLKNYEHFKTLISQVKS